MQCSSGSLSSLKTLVSHPSYDKIDTFSVDEYGLQGVLYKHRKSGAEVVSIAAPDDNKVFGITFRTPPKDSTGVPHVLEHSVLCGSQKFPVKEPFVDMLRGSLQNFLNAFTYPDRTCYPVASTNTKDFYNLVHVYLDAVLHPRAVSDPQVLQQEGWHYELEGDDPSGALSIKGVVYNEMKGVYSSPDSLLNRAAQRALFPDNAYAVDSGGDPRNIPDLTFDQFRSFHSFYYHPSNSRVFFYGDDDPLQRLELLDEYLKEFDSVSTDSSRVQLQPKLSALKRVEVSFPISPEAELKHMLTVNWVLNHSAMKPKDALALGMLDYLLLGTSSSALKKALIESNLGESVVGGGLSDELLQSTFSVGLKGVNQENIAKVEELIRITLERFAKEGFSPEDIQAAVNSYEFRLREFNTGGFPKGLSVMLGMMREWVYGRNPVDGVRFEEPLRELKAQLARGEPVFQNLLKSCLVENTHKVVVEMRPDTELEEKHIAEENAMLTKIKAGMSEAQLKNVVEEAQRLREAQEAPDSPEARATLPRLDLSDISRTGREHPIEVMSKESLARVGISDATVLQHDLDTAGILYADVAFDYSMVDREDLELMPLFTKMLMESGTSDCDLATMTRRIATSTGGIGVSLHSDLKSSGNKISSGDQALVYLLLRGKAVSENIPVLFNLFGEIILTANLSNQQRAVELLREIKAKKESAILSSGHAFAAARLGSRHSFLGHLNEVTAGLTSVRAAGTLLEHASSNWPALEARLQRMRNAIVQRGSDSLIVNLTGNKNLLTSALPSVKAFVDTLPVRATTTTTTASANVVKEWKKPDDVAPINEGFVIPSQVNYVGMGGPILVPGSTVKGSYAVAARHLSTGHLWDQVRVVGGAYGGFGRFSEASGRFVYLSYRDPNCIDTINVYESSPDALTETELSSEDLLQAVIGAVGDLDAPLSADHRGFVSLVQYLNGQTPADRQRWRSEVLATQGSDFHEFAEHLRKLRETGSIVVFGTQSAIDSANSKLPVNRQMKVEQAMQGSKK